MKEEPGEMLPSRPDGLGLSHRTHDLWLQTAPPIVRLIFG